jgi:DNA-binding transcriptional regulator/RsmH inhibitor MraZ
MFYSASISTLDDKGRVSFPGVFRQQTGEDVLSFVALSWNASECHLFTKADFEEWVRNRFPKQQGKPSREEQENRRAILGSAEPLELDDHKRFCLSKELRERLGLAAKDKIQFIGDDDHIVLTKSEGTTNAKTAEAAYYGEAA